MKMRRLALYLAIFTAGFVLAPSAHADTLTLTSGNNATTTPNVATAITGFQIVGPSASTTPVKIHVTNGTVHVSAVSGVTISGNSSATLTLSGTVADLNTALSTLTYTRTSTGTDTLEVALVNSNQIYFPDNGHVYQYVAGSISWNDAQPAAEALTAYGATGYLVTITSEAENNFVKARLSGDAWIGASDNGANEGAWKWVTGPEAGTQFWSGNGSGSTTPGQYSSWASGEPNDSGSNEDCGEEYVADGKWNDLPCGTTVSGYVAEFGSDDDPATVVSKDISIVTADVPAVTSLFPANGATNATTTANLVISFSKTVSPDTGDILLKKSSDDSTVETIPVGDDRVTGGGTSSILINPDTTLDEGVSYYISIPGTAFEDADGNHFDGFTDSTTWTFTTEDVTAPEISNIATSSLTSSGVTLSWTTNEDASTKIVYSVDEEYASSTAETDTSSRVTSHSATLSDLLACTLYNYKVVSADAAGNYATSSADTFVTTGCPGGATPASVSSNRVLTDRETLAQFTNGSNDAISVRTPQDFTTASSSVVLQFKRLPADSVLGALGTPSGVSVGASVVFDVTALVDNVTTLDTFDTPVTIGYLYTNSGIADLDESTLKIYHYHNGSWVPLDNCSIDEGINIVSCTTTSFSVFALFGTPNATAAPASQSSSGSRGSGGTIQGQVANLLALGKTAQAEALKAQWPQLFGGVQLAQSGTASSAIISAVRDLFTGMTGDDVLALQKLLNANGFTLAASGAGSPGNETTYFGALTRAALATYQSAHNISPAAGYFGPITRAQMKAAGLVGIWW